MAVTYRRRGRAGAVQSSNAVRDPGAELVDYGTIAAAGADAYVNQQQADDAASMRAWQEGMASLPPVQLSSVPGLPTYGVPNYQVTPVQPGPLPDIELDLTKYGLTNPADYTGKAFGELARLNKVTNEDITYQNAQAEIDRKEADLRQAMLDGDMDRVRDLIAEIAAARDYMKQSYQDYRNTVVPVYDQAIQASSVIQDDLTKPLEDIALAEQGAISAAFGTADADIAAEAALIGADNQARAAAQQIAGELTSMYLETSEGRQDDAQRILQALETAAYESAKAFKVEDLWNIDNRERIDMAQRDKAQRKAEGDLDDLALRQQQLDLDRQRMKLAHDETLRRLKEAGSSPYMDEVGFGQLTAQMALNDLFRLNGVPLDRQARLQEVFKVAMANGITNGEQMAEWLNTQPGLADGDESTIFQQMVNPLGLESMAPNPNEVNWLISAMGSYSSGRSTYSGLASMNDAGVVTTGPITEQIQSWKSSVDNGRIPSSMLVSVSSDHGSTVHLAPFAATAWTAMVEAAAADGVVITPGGSYRTYQTQVDLAEEKGLYSQGGLAATPGTSKHGYGLAVDIHGITPAQSAWLQNNAVRFGFKTIPREPWHWEFYGGSTYNETYNASS